MEIKNGSMGSATENNIYTDTQAIKTETDKMPATIVKVDSLETKTDFPTQNLATNTTIAQVVGNKTDSESGNSLYSKAYIADKDSHSRSYTYPFKAAPITLAGGADAWVEGSKVEIVPTATDDVQTLTITHASDSAGIVDVILDDIRYPVSIPTGTINEIAEFLRQQTYTNNYGETTWTVTGADADVVFTASGQHAEGSFLDVGSVTGVTASLVHTTVGVGIGKPFDMHYFTPSSPDATTTYQIIFWVGLAGRESRIATMRAVKGAAQDTLEAIPLQTPLLDAGTRITASLATLAGGSDEIDIAIAYHLY